VSPDEPVNGAIAALTRAVIYEKAKEALTPLLNARPDMAEELSESLATRQLANRPPDRYSVRRKISKTSLADRVAANIRVFSRTDAAVTARSLRIMDLFTLPYTRPRPYMCRNIKTIQI